MLDELEVVEVIGDNGRFGVKVYRVEVSRLGSSIFGSSTYLGRYGISGDLRFDAGPSTKAGECVGVVLPVFMELVWVIDNRFTPVPTRDCEHYHPCHKGSKDHT